MRFPPNRPEVGDTTEWKYKFALLPKITVNGTTVWLEHVATRKVFKEQRRATKIGLLNVREWVREYELPENVDR